MIKLEEFAQRRKKIMQKVGNESVVIISAAPEQARSNDVHYPYRQDSNFQYLTGFPESDAIAVLLPGREQGEYILFNQVQDQQKLIWTGPIIGQKGACDDYGVDQAFSIDDIDKHIPNLINNCKRIYYLFSQGDRLAERIKIWVEQARKLNRRERYRPYALYDLMPHLSELRLFKSDAEIALMKKAATISADAHKTVMKVSGQVESEHALAAEFLYEISRNGCQSPAYPSIVACGANGCILHYIKNDAPLVKGELLLIDAGGEYQYYAADITRTYPLGGSFSPQQKAIYELVLKAQMSAIDQAKPGIAWNELQNSIISIITAGLVQLGILKGNVNDLIEQAAYKKYYMHNSGHWIGIDVHDVGRYKTNGNWRKLEPGMVFTVEPGIYIPADDESVDEQFRGIAVRIEDEVLITSAGHEVLTKNVPKQVTEVEEILKEGNR